MTTVISKSAGTIKSWESLLVFVLTCHKIDTCMVQHYISRHGHVIEYSYVYYAMHNVPYMSPTHLYVYTYETVLCMPYHDYTIYLDY